MRDWNLSLEYRKFLFKILMFWATVNLLWVMPSIAILSCGDFFRHPHQAIAQSLLIAKSKPIHHFKKNTPRHLDERIHRVLFSKDIESSDLPYESGIRAPLTLSPAALLANAQEFTQVQSLKVTDILIGSETKPSMYSLVRLGFLPDGRPVAVKTIFKNSIPKARDEARGAKILSDLGLFPTYHGFWFEGREVSLVTDIAPGELKILPTQASLVEIQQLTQAFARLTKVGIFKLPQQEVVLQYNLSSDQKLILIDADGFYERIADSHPRLIDTLNQAGAFSTSDLQPRKYTDLDYLGYDWGHILGEYIKVANPETALTALIQLKSIGGVLWEKTMDHLGDELTFQRFSFHPNVAKFIADN